MDTLALVENNIDDGQLLVEQFVADGNSVTVAFWIKTEEEGQLFLCIATETVERVGPAAAYAAIAASLRKLPDPWVRMTELKLVGPNDPITKSVLGLLARHPGPLPGHFGPQTLGNLSVEDVYVYPRKTEKVKIYGLEYPDEPNGALYLSFEPRDSNDKLIIGSGEQGKTYSANTIKPWTVAAPEGSSLEHDDKGRLVLAWNLRGNRKHSNANEVWSLANLRLQGFRFLREPEAADENSENQAVQRSLALDAMSPSARG